MKRNVFYCVLLMSILLSACASAPAATATTNPPTQTSIPPTAEVTVTQEPLSTESPVSLQLTSDAFEPDGPIPPKYACGAENVSPALHWNEPPAGTQTFAIIMDDPDAGSVPFVHWVIFNIPASARGLPEAVPATDTLPDGTVNGRSGMFTVGYVGPCPPSNVHHYHFHLYALDTTIDLPSVAGKGELLIEMEGHILAEAELIGTFTK